MSSRPKRNHDKISMPKENDSVLEYNRMRTLFFINDDDVDAKQDAKQVAEQDEAVQQLKIGNWLLQRVFTQPNIYVIDNFLSSIDLEYLHDTIVVNRDHFRASFVDRNSDGVVDRSLRDSWYLPLDKQGDKKLSDIETKGAKLMGHSTNECIEPLQIVKYLPGQCFGNHHDMADYNEETGETPLPEKHVYVKRRLVTMFCYLNDLEPHQGGCTVFPTCFTNQTDRTPLRVQPRRGRAVVFSNVTKEGRPDPRTIHAGEKVISTSTTEPIKYGFNMWLCEK